MQELFTAAIERKFGMPKRPLGRAVGGPLGRVVDRGALGGSAAQQPGNQQSMNMEQQEPKSDYTDFKIVGKVLYICRATNQLKRTSDSRNVELELSLLSFIAMFKSQVISDISLIALADSLLEEGREEGSEPTKQDNNASYDVLARLSGHNTMGEILEMFAQKIIRNLMSSSVDDEGGEKRIVDQSLDVFCEYLTNRVSSRQLTALPVVKQLATTHVAQFSILQQPSQRK